MSKPQKILVVGASIAGPALCYWLKKFGFIPTLIEKNKTLRQGGFAIDIRGIAIDIVKQMGIYEKICDRRTQLTYGRYVDALGNTLHEEQGEKFGFRQGEDVEIVRGDLVELLMQEIEEVPCYFNQNIDDITQHENYIDVHFKDGRTEQYHLVIGADGLHSSIRRMLFDQEYQRINLGSYLSVFSIPNYLNLDHSEILFEKQEKLIHINSDKNPESARAGLMFRSQIVLNERSSEKEQQDFLRKTFQNMGWEANKILELMQDSTDFYFDAIEQINMPFWTKGRVALVGDSGYCASPLSGQGTSLALVGAYVLAGELRAAGENYSQAFSRYNELLHPFVKANQEFGAWVSETFLRKTDVSKEVAEKRADLILKKLKTAAHAITLPCYSF